MLKKICQYSLDGIFIKIWDSIIEASDALGINFRSIADCCRGEHCRAGEYMWRFYNDNTDNIPSYKTFVHDKYVLQFDLNNNFIKKWNSTKEISETLHIRRNNIISVCTGKRKSAGGFKWKYA